MLTNAKLPEKEEIFLKALAKKILAAQNIILTTHRECDGDGLGAELAIFHALKKIKKNVRVINVDPTPKKYHFLNPNEHIQYFETQKPKIEKSDLALIFDTNDERQLNGLFSELKTQCKEVLFIDHHPVLNEGPLPTAGSFIDTKAASTGEIAYYLIQEMNIELDQKMAQAIYTSVAFDTHLYRFVRNSPHSHLIAAELLKYNIQADAIHRALFSNQTIEKTAFMAKTLSKIEYYENGKVAYIKINKADLLAHDLDGDEARDIIDGIMNIETLEAAILVREDGPQDFKVSLRSKGNVQLLKIAEELGGGGHPSAAGAYVTSDPQILKERLLLYICSQVANGKK